MNNHNCSKNTREGPTTNNNLANQLVSDGFVLPDVPCTADLLERLLVKFHRRHKKVKEALNGKEIGIGSRAGYKEIVQRSPGRWDIPISPEKFGIEERQTNWWPLISAVLGDDAEHSFSGVVFSDPDSPAQCWHIDSPHLSPAHRPAHALNVMLALHDIPMNMGPTEYARGSHVLTNHLCNPSLQPEKLTYQDTGTCPEWLVKDTEHEVPESFATELAAGFCQVFDDRLLHRGLANLSKKVRYVAYFSYRQKGYSSNTHFESRQSVFND
jgi:hypothetical protein